MSGPADFAYGDGSRALGLDAPGWFEKIIPVAVQEAKLGATLPASPNDPEPAAFLLAWPDTKAGLISCIRKGQDGESSEFVVAWPFARTGVIHQMEIEAVHQDEDCGQIHLVEGRIGEVGLSVFDTFCICATRQLLQGHRVAVRLHAWAVMLEPASTEPIRYKPEDVSPSMREAFWEAFERDGELVLHTDRLVAFLPVTKGPSPLHELRSSVKGVREGAPLLGMSVWVLTLTFARPEDDDIELDLEISVTSGVWKGAAPKAGDAVQGLIWLQAGFE